MKRLANVPASLSRSLARSSLRIKRMPPTMRPAERADRHNVVMGLGLFTLPAPVEIRPADRTACAASSSSAWLNSWARAALARAVGEPRGKHGTLFAADFG